MVEVRLLDRLRALSARRRWLIGITVGSACRQVTAALVGAEGHGLASRVEVATYRRLTVPRASTQLFQRLRQGSVSSPAGAALLAAQLAECQAMLLDELAAEIAPVWDRVLAVAVDDPGMWQRADGLTAYAGLCDAARLAELTGLNVIDAFPARDLAQEGRGRPLLPIPNWMLLHDLEKTRVLVELKRGARLTYLPGSRDPEGAAGVLHVKLAPRSAAESEPAELAASIAEGLATRLPQRPRVDELVLCGRDADEAFIRELSARLPSISMLDVRQLGIAREALKPAGVALLGLLHLDQTPASAPRTTGLRTPRVLGRLTPGSLPNWHRLVRELAGSKPSVVSLRSAM